MGFLIGNFVTYKSKNKIQEGKFWFRDWSIKRIQNLILIRNISNDSYIKISVIWILR